MIPATTGLRVSISFVQAPFIPANDEMLPTPDATFFFEDSNDCMDKSVAMTSQLKEWGYRPSGKPYRNWFDKREGNTITRTYIEGYYYFAYNPKWPDCLENVVLVTTQTWSI